MRFRSFVELQQQATQTISYEMKIHMKRIIKQQQPPKKSPPPHLIKDGDLEDYETTDMDIKIAEVFDGNYIRNNDGTHLHGSIIRIPWRVYIAKFFL